MAVEILKTPGHSDDSIVFKSDEILITGDTLFTGTIGNCYTGDYETYFNSLKSLVSLPGNHKIYPGHDLRRYAMGVAARLDPENKDIAPYLDGYNPEDEWSTLAEEMRVNPFLRWNDPALAQALGWTKELYGSDIEKFRALMKLH